MIRSPKELFHASQYISPWKDIINGTTSSAFEHACQTALAELVRSLPESSPDPSRAWDSYLQILGARKVIEILSSLHEPAEKPKPIPYDTLNYKV